MSRCDAAARSRSTQPPAELMLRPSDFHTTPTITIMGAVASNRLLVLLLISPGAFSPAACCLLPAQLSGAAAHTDPQRLVPLRRWCWR